MANEIFLNNNEKFHVFSKSPITPSMGLAQAVNKSGHTTTTSDVWSQDIPWFFSVDDQATALTTGKDAKLNDLVLIGSNVFKRNETAYSDTAAFTDLWESLTLEDGTKLYNSDKKHVLTYHKGVSVTFLTTANNAKQASNYAGRVFKSDGSVIEQFVASTDKVSSGVPSTGYGVAVYNNGSPLSQGEAETNFIANSYAGIIQFNTKVGPSTAYTADVFEYVGEKLNTSITELAKKVESVTATAGEGVQAVTDAATTAGLSVSTKEIIVEGQTDPVTVKALDIDVAEVSADGDVTSGDEAKLVTATGAQNIAKAAIDAAISGTEDADGAIEAAIEAAIADATLADTDNAIANSSPTADEGEVPTEKKLVTAEQVKEYVEDNAKVTLTADTATGKTGITIDKNSQAATSFTIGIDQTTIATKQSVDDLSDVVSGVAQTVTDIQTSLSTGSIATAIQAAQDTADEAKGIAETAVQSVKVNGTEAKSGTAVSITALTAVDTSATGSNGITIGETADKKVTLSVTPATYTKKDGDTPGTWGDDKTNFATAQSVIDAIADAVGAITIPVVTTTEDAQGVGVTADGHVVDVDTATYTKAEYDENGNVTTQGSWEAATKDYLVTGDVVRDFVGDETAKVLKEANDFSKSLHTTSVTYHVTDTLPTVPSGEEEDYKGRIYLVLTGLENKVAADGARIEYMYINKGTEDAPQWGWEQIGTTTADLSGYAKTADLNVPETKANGLTYSQTNGVVSVSVDAADTSKVGTVQLTDTYTSTDDTNAATGKSIAAAIATLDATNVGDGAVKVSQTDGKVSSVSVATEALVEDGAIKASVTDVNALITAKDALAAIKLAKPENYVASVTGYTTAGEEVTTTQGAAVKVLDGRGTSVTANDLWGTTATMDASGVITVDHKYLSNPNGTSAWLSNVTKVENNKAYNGDSVVANIQTEMIKDGTDMFGGTSLTSFNGDLSSLVNGQGMFYYSTSLASFSGDLSSLVEGGNMFYRSSLESFSGDLSSLVGGHHMFYQTSIESFSSKLSSLVNGSYMFCGTELTSFNINLPSLVKGDNMFRNCTKLTSFSGDLSSLVEGTSMFSRTSLTSFNGDLRNLVNGHAMFSVCNNLTSFSSDLSSLVNGQGMFNNTSLTSFSSDLSSLVNGYTMFYYSSLESFSGDLSSLVNGYRMFYNNSLASFNGDLSSLVNGQGMFWGNSLDTESVECIADTIRNVTDLADAAITGSDGETYNVTKRIDIGIANETPNEVENAAFLTMKQEKGWSVYVNGSASEYEPTAIATLDENGEEVSTPIPFWAKPVETDEEHAEYVGEDGKFYKVVGGQFIYVSDPETYGQFTSLADAVANMRLTKIEKKA